MFPHVLRNGSVRGIKVDYVRESKPLGTAAPLRTIKGLRETFLVLNGDILTDLDYRDVIRFHRQRSVVATIATFRRHVPVDFGVIEADRDGLIRDYHEKPKLSYKVSMGVYVFEPQVLDYIPKRGRFDFPQLIDRLLGADLPVASYPFRGRWLDIGRPDDYERAQTEMARHAARYMGGSA
jgi:NDP-sugar pyrophosphorylase family protein